MDFLYNIYHLLVDFFLIIVYFFQKLGESLGSLINLALLPFNFLKDIVTNLNFSASQSLDFNFNQYFDLLDNLGSVFNLILSLLVVILLWVKLKKIFS
jgi:hypothetical protein